jgi:hypothetical protein
MQWSLSLFIRIFSVAVTICVASGGSVKAATPSVQPHGDLNFTNGATAKKFGVHEVTLIGNAAVANPFATAVSVTFLAPSGRTVMVDAFYDGGDIWRARVYVEEAGVWRWVSTSYDDPALHNQSGSFTAAHSHLRGMLRKHRRNPRQWMTDDGKTFLNLSDTAYRFFKESEALWQDYSRDIVAMGMTSIRVLALGDWDWDLYWEDHAKTRFRLSAFQTTDVRLHWLLDHYPHLYIQLILFPDGEPSDDAFWTYLPHGVRERTMRYMIARWAAFPQLFWLVTNDTTVAEDRPHNRAWAQEVGQYFARQDPWRHLISFGPIRRQVFPFTKAKDLKWVSYIHLQTAYALAADQVRAYANTPLHVFCGEDLYEQTQAATNPAKPRYFYRRLFWSWLLSGGSATYGGRIAIQPYSQTNSLAWTNLDGQSITTPLEGLDSVRYIVPYLTEHHIDLALFHPADELVTDLSGESEVKQYVAKWFVDIVNDPSTIWELWGGGFKTYITNWFSTVIINNAAFGSARPKAARRGKKEYLVYHPNAKAGEVLGEGPAAETSRRNADVDPAKTVRIQVDLRESPGVFSVEWFRAHDGVVEKAHQVAGGAKREFVAPWKGCDVVLRLLLQHNHVG